MKLKFKTQAYQTAAVQAVVDCFKGQVPQQGGVRYRLDPDLPLPVYAKPGVLVAESPYPAWHWVQRASLDPTAMQKLLIRFFFPTAMISSRPGSFTF